MMAKLHGLDWHSIKETLKIIGAPTTAQELGMGQDILVEALVKARTIRPERYTILDEVKLTEKSARSLAKECRVI